MNKRSNKEATMEYKQHIYVQHIKKEKCGKTILTNDTKQYDYSKLTGLVETFNVKSVKESNAVFLKFDTIENAQDALAKLRSEKIRSKPSYYKGFFKIESKMKGPIQTLIDAKIEFMNSATYDELKNTICEMIKKKCDQTEVLFFKFNKNKQTMKLSGSGDFTIDTKNDLDLLIKEPLDINDSFRICFYNYQIRPKTR